MKKFSFLLWITCKAWENQMYAYPQNWILKMFQELNLAAELIEERETKSL